MSQTKEPRLELDVDLNPRNPSHQRPCPGTRMDDPVSGGSRLWADGEVESCVSQPLRLSERTLRLSSGVARINETNSNRPFWHGNFSM